MAATTSIDQKETTSLIGSDKVEGTAVYGPDRGKIGSLERVMIDKLSGKVAYAVLSFGGFLGMGERDVAVKFADHRAIFTGTAPVAGAGNITGVMAG